MAENFTLSNGMNPSVLPDVDFVTIEDQNKTTKILLYRTYESDQSSFFIRDAETGENLRRWKHFGDLDERIEVLAKGLPKKSPLLDHLSDYVLRASVYGSYLGKLEEFVAQEKEPIPLFTTDSYTFSAKEFIRIDSELSNMDAAFDKV